MNAQEAILKIKALFEDAAAPEVPVAEPIETKVELMEYSLADGSKVEISALEVGGEVKLVDGTIPAMGEYQLMDGTSFQIDENGIIVEVASPKEDAMPEEVAAEKDVKLDELASKFNQVLSLNEDLQNKVNELESKVKQGFAQVAELIEALSIQPNADPIQKPNSFSSFISTNDIKEQRLNKYRNAILNK